ncbi:auxin-induced protein X15-like [Gossypium australe]|uniref:Auxin-induced protein X15-like n=1 Tax=Gossypium australe TaxID=47621 RepID=A0A5B6X1X1_9ROSI|nr:auxin-induced protein X15-like [Gossypium australe]
MAIRLHRIVSVNKVPKGYFVVYVGENQKQFVIPVSFLNQPYFQELLGLSEESSDIVILLRVSQFPAMKTCHSSCHHSSMMFQAATSHELIGFLVLVSAFLSRFSKLFTFPHPNHLTKKAMGFCLPRIVNAKPSLKRGLSFSETSMVPKGHSAVYFGEVDEKKRFIVPISLLKHPSF